MSSHEVSDVVIDLSHYNEVTSFSEAKAGGIVGVIHKATQGTSGVDPTYASRRPQALAAGLWWGAYHFGTGDDVVAQAQHFLSTVNPGPQDLLALDFEGDGNDTMTLEQAEQFVSAVYQQTGRYPGLYSGSLAGNDLANNPSTVLANCWFWRAEYGVSSPVVPSTWPTWTMWQYTSGGTAPGIGGACDRDQFNGSLDALALLWGTAG